MVLEKFVKTRNLPTWTRVKQPLPWSANPAVKKFCTDFFYLLNIYIQNDFFKKIMRYNPLFEVKIFWKQKILYIYRQFCPPQRIQLKFGANFLKTATYDFS